ncbi:MAG TPA: hypothetical protein PL124_06285 [Candidatus Cloacimonadota bacterium]|nr:hypothetical protein [Candidatus Cloacimonadota bacterium]HPS39003.1 hypothetical protein [Candidatus Cloacimonadota bacterium]
MKRSFKEKYHILLIILFGIIVLESLLLLVTLNRTAALTNLITDMQSIIIIFVFLIFVYMIVLYNYIPFRMHRAIKELKSVVEEITNGNYYIDIDSTMYDQDKDIQDVILALQKMLGIIVRFDQVKAEKIFEHHQRILQLINIIKQNVLITSINGDVVYCNDKFRERYPTITEMNNINELIFQEEFNSKLFATLAEALRYGNNLYEIAVHDDRSTKAVVINGSIVRNRKGSSSGAVFVLDFGPNEPKD